MKGEYATLWHEKHGYHMVRVADRKHAEGYERHGWKIIAYGRVQGVAYT